MVGFFVTYRITSNCHWYISCLASASWARGNWECTDRSVNAGVTHGLCLLERRNEGDSAARELVHKLSPFHLPLVTILFVYRRCIVGRGWGEYPLLLHSL